jgi:hypothetical protein|nr:MAG TPA: hypothetical protein [Caudoviricetes sp.]
MDKKYAEIINEGKKQGAPVEAINAELKAAGANFHLNPDGGVAGWTEQEMKEGFIPGEDDGKDGIYKIASDGKPIRYSNKALGGGVYGVAIPVMDRDESRADTTITVGHWELSYDSRGCCYSRKNLRK